MAPNEQSPPFLYRRHRVDHIVVDSFPKMGQLRTLPVGHVALVLRSTLQWLLRPRRGGSGRQRPHPLQRL
jgi:hypothetical protein